ncbi:MAG: ribosomal protein S18 acetylase RimI-like enzyme [Crocinitomicaceae bacterium]|jgi:ribosomal protein S18 acetylase RimI-like enzyme
MHPVKEDLKYKLINKFSGRTSLVSEGNVKHFLFKHLEEYGDNLTDINSAIEYIFEKVGGFALVQFYKNKISGVVVVNETGMSGYIPENILVYIAVDGKYRGKGFGQELMTFAIKSCKGDIALHVEKENPARFLYEKLGFTTPYLEMRLKR